MASIGLPPPKQVSLLGAPWTEAKYHLQYDPKSGISDVVLRRILTWSGTQPLETEATALMRAQFIDGLPVCQQYRLLSRAHLPWPAAVHSYLPGTSGRDLIREDRANKAVVANALGTVLAQLADAEMPRFGTRIDAGQFAPARGSWKAEWQAMTGHFLARADGSGLLLQPAVDELTQHLNARWDVLDSVSEFCLVHGDLHPGNLLFEGEPDARQLSGVIDWESALAGDPLVDWALPIQRASTGLVEMVKAYGPERVRTFLEPEALGRLHVYVLTRNLAGLAHMSRALFYGDAGVRRSWILEWMRLQMQNQDETRLRERLKAALEGTVEQLALIQPVLHTYRLELWQTLEALRFAPLNTSPRIEPYLGALGACFVARETPEVGTGWRQIAKGAVRHMGPQAVPFPQDKITDREQWKRNLLHRILESLPGDEDPGHCLSVSALGLSFAAFKDIEWTLADGHLRGLETLVEGLLVVEKQRRGQTTSVQTRLTHGLLGWAALLWLREHHEDLSSNWDVPTEALETQTLDAWQDLQIHSGSAKNNLKTEDIVRDWPLTAGTREAGSAVPAVLWAVQQLINRGMPLPSDAGPLWHLLDIPTPLNR